MEMMRVYRSDFGWTEVEPGVPENISDGEFTEIEEKLFEMGGHLQGPMYAFDETLRDPDNGAILGSRKVLFCKFSGVIRLKTLSETHDL